MIVDMAWIVLLVLAGLALKLPFPEWGLPAVRRWGLQEVALVLIAVSMLLGWAELYAAHGTKGVTQAEPTPRAERTVKLK